MHEKQSILTMMLLIRCPSPVKTQHNTLLHTFKPFPKSTLCRGLFKKENVRGKITISVSMRKEKKPPTVRGDLSEFNEDIGSQTVFLQSAPLVSQHDSQHDTKYIKVQNRYYQFTEHPSSCNRYLHSEFFLWQRILSGFEAKLWCLYLYILTQEVC